MSAVHEKVTICVLNFNGAASIPKAVERLRALRYEAIEEIIFLDNGSTDGSVEILAKHAADFRVITSPVNQGAAGGRNRLLEAALTDLVLLLDIDSFPEPDALTLMVDAYNADPDRIAIVHPRIVREGDPTLIEYDGTRVHFLGIGSVENRYARVSEVSDGTRVVTCTGGNTLISKRNVALSGWYDEDFFFGYEDQDFTVRATLSVKHCVQVSRAIVRHGEGTAGISMRSGVKYSCTRAFYYTRNRQYFIFKTYSWSTMLMLAPALLAYELLQFAFMVRTGNVAAWARAWCSFVRTFGSKMRKRRRVQQNRTIPDRDILRGEEITFPLGLSSSRLLRHAVKSVDAFFKIYWRIVRPLI